MNDKTREALERARKISEEILTQEIESYSLPEKSPRFGSVKSTCGLDTYYNPDTIDEPAALEFIETTKADIKLFAEALSTPPAQAEIGEEELVEIITKVAGDIDDALVTRSNGREDRVELTALYLHRVLTTGALSRLRSRNAGEGWQPIDAVRAAAIEECAKVADRDAAQAQEQIDRNYEYLRRTGGDDESCNNLCRHRKYASEGVARSIRLLAPTPPQKDTRDQ